MVRQRKFLAYKSVVVTNYHKMSHQGVNDHCMLLGYRCLS